jgi:hypothetical protein
MRLDLCAEPLYDYLRKRPIARRPPFVRTTTACHRSYVGTWEIRDGTLWLVGIDGLIETAHGIVEADLETALPWVKGALPASWVSDRLRCPEGRLVNYVHAGYASQYERDRFFDFERGRLVAEWLVLNPPAPIFYRIDERGDRTCFDCMCSSEECEIPDPLAGHDLDQAHLAWGRPPVVQEGEEAGYVVAAAALFPPR